MQKILVMGASRGVGLETVRLALAEGFAVRAFSRSAGRIPISHEHLEKMNGNALESADVTRAVTGCDAVIQTLGVSFGLAEMTGPVRLFSGATRVLLPAMREAGVRRLISVTGFGAGESRRKLPLLQRPAFDIVLGRVYADKDEQERLIRHSGLDWTIVRPVILTRLPGTGHYQVLTEPGRWRGGLISRADVADFLVGQINDRRFIGKAPVLCG